MPDAPDDAHPLTPAQLRRINRLATSARMVAGLAHELNNSLQVVSGLVELLGDRDDVPTDVQARIGKIGAQADKATQAIRQVLTYTREVGPETGAVDLAALADKAVSLRRYNLGRAGVVVSTVPSPSAIAVPGDDRAMLQVLLNLILNAEEALLQQPARELRITVEAREGLARVQVHDTGHGVADSLQEKIFEPFFTTRSDERAVGLGLPVARALAAQDGGDVLLASSHPGATTFVAQWPI
jgi:signal transduction histidine kinase